MNEHTKGKVEVTIINDIVYIVSAHKEIAIICIKPDAGHLYKPAEMEANANHIVDCWNAFEKDGLVENLRKQLKEYSLAIQKLAPRNSKMEEFLTKGK